MRDGCQQRLATKLIAVAAIVATAAALKRSIPGGITSTDERVASAWRVSDPGSACPGSNAIASLRERLAA